MSDQRTLKIDGGQIDFIRLLLRSPDQGEGWRSVSSLLRPLATKMVEAQPELYETRPDGEALMLRLSSDGSILGRYV